MSGLHETLTRTQKALVLLALDGLAMLVSVLLALQLRVGELWPDRFFGEGYGMFVLAPLIGMLVSWIMGVPRIVLRSFELRALQRLVLFAFLMSLVIAALNQVLAFDLPRSLPGIWAGVYLILAIFIRLGLLGLIDRLQSRRGGRKNVLIYGAGGTGQQLAAALRSSREHNPVGFIDDNPALRRVSVSGLRVYLPADLGEVVPRLAVDQVILAMPSVRPSERREKLAVLRAAGVEVLTLPPIVDLLGGAELREQIRPVSPDELLGREAVDLASPEVAGAYTGKTVMISGAGGSIGSELTRQILTANPAKVVLFDNGEYALYAIDRELRGRTGPGPEIATVLGSVTDARRVAETLRAHSVDIILHAAAYKHVPMIEENPLEGARNNILGTAVLADAALDAGVERFILVSTDKAVRPTNVMGATKRMAEMVVQDRQRRSRGTVFAMVRFGNVLGSSGSVIPLFREQIRAGGPITLTHPEVTRYFMTIPEAAQLVLLAGSFAEGGEVYVLDMGKPVRIMDLARSLVELSGLTVRDARTPEGDIEIVVTGLRPGEKLYEELLIDEAAAVTPHPKILRAAEKGPSEAELTTALARVADALERGDAGAVRAVLEGIVPGFGTPGAQARPA